MSEPVEPVMSITITAPSLKLSFLIILFYFFALIPLTAGTIHILVLAGFPSNIIKANLSEGMLIAHICLTVTMTYYLVKRYTVYLLSERWKANFINYLSVGLKWSTPLLIIHMISLLIPSIREKVIEGYMSMRIISVKDISIVGLLIFSVWILLGAIFEEIIFRNSDFL